MKGPNDNPGVNDIVVTTQIPLFTTTFDVPRRSYVIQMSRALSQRSLCPGRIKHPLLHQANGCRIKARIYSPPSDSPRYGIIRHVPSPASKAWANQHSSARTSWLSPQGQRIQTEPSTPKFVIMASIKGHPDPAPLRTASPAPLAQDFSRQQVAKQQRSNFHSSSISSGVSITMVSQSVNKTALHPTGVQ